VARNGPEQVMIRDNFTRRPDNRAGDLRPTPPRQRLNLWGIAGIAICLVSALVMGAVIALMVAGI